MNTGKALIALVSLGFAAWVFTGGVERKVAQDAIEQYEIAVRSNDPTQICVQAGLVSAAYMQAKDEQKFREWRRTETRACQHMLDVGRNEFRPSP